MTALTIALGAIVGTAIVWLASGRLEMSTDQLAKRYGIPDIVNGSVLMAVSSSMPELATAVLAVQVHGDFELGMSAIIGSAIYNILVIPAAAVFLRGRALEANRDIVYREAQFYLVSVAAIMVVLSMAVIYHGGAVVGDDGRRLFMGQFTRGLAFIPLALYSVYLFMQFTEVRSSRVSNPPDRSVSAWKHWSILVVSILAVVVGVEMLLRVAIRLGEVLNTPTFLWGMTVVAAATSLPDTFISIKASMAGRSESSLSNVLGSNVFDLLVAMPVAVLVAGAVTINFTQVVPMMTFLVVATVVILVFMLYDMKLTPFEAAILAGLYVVFGLWMALEAFGVTHLLAIT